MCFKIEITSPFVDLAKFFSCSSIFRVPPLTPKKGACINIATNKKPENSKIYMKSVINH